MKVSWLLFSFQGRVNRLPFWLFTVTAILVLYFGGWLLADFADLPFSVGVDLVALIVLLPALAVQTKRWHDRNKSAWWILINFVPVVGPLWVLVECGALEGTRGKNAFGADPLGRTAAPDSWPDSEGATRDGGDGRA